jgi:hypothetical protein
MIEACDGRAREPEAVRDGGTGTLPPTHVAERNSNADAAGARNMEWGSRMEIAMGSAAMTRERFESMSHYEQLRWLHATRRVEIVRPEHHVVLKWWGD